MQATKYVNIVYLYDLYVYVYYRFVNTCIIKII